VTEVLHLEAIARGRDCQQNSHVTWRNLPALVTV